MIESPDEEPQGSEGENLTENTEESGQTSAGEAKSPSAGDDAALAERESMLEDEESDQGESDQGKSGKRERASVKGAKGGGGRVPAVHEVEIDAYAILGTAAMPVSQLLRMGRGAVVELDTGLGDLIDIKVNDVLVARGEIVVVQDRIAIEITEVIKRDKD